MPVRRVAAALLAGLVLPVLLGFPALAAPSAAAPSDAAPSAAAPDRRVVLVGVAGLQWDDVSAAATPTLWRIAADGAVASLSVRTVRPRACPLDGWLTVNAGARASAERPGSGDGTACPDIPAPASASGVTTLPGLTAAYAYNDQFGYDPRFGLLARAVPNALAVGPGAAVALADQHGALRTYLDSPAALDRAALERHELTVVDLGTLPEGPGRAAAVQAADRELGQVVALATLPGDRTTLMVAGLADSGWTPHLHVVASLRTGSGAGDTGTGGRWLTASSTRHRGLVQLTDVTPTVLAALGRDVDATADTADTADTGDTGDALVGAVMDTAGGRPGSTAATVRRLAEADTAAQLVRDTVGRFFVLFTAVLVLAVAAALAVPGRRGQRAARAGLVFVSSVPVATFLANLLPWWRAGAPVAVLAAAVVGWAAVVAAVALLGPWRRHPLGPAGAVAAVTVLVLAADVVAGSPLQMSSLLGLSPLVAGRFYGFGNVAFAVFAMAAVFAATWAAALLAERGQPGRAALAVAGAGAVAVAADGWPSFGADFGGVLAMVPGFALLGLGVSGRRLSVVRLAVVAAVAVVTVGAIAVLDWLRPPAERSHLGRFVQQVLDGDAWAVVGRKAETNLHSFTNPLSLLVPVLFVLLVWLILRPERFRASALARAYEAVPVLRTGLVALYVTAVLGFAVNDSGVMVPAVALTMAVPLAVAAVAAQRKA